MYFSRVLNYVKKEKVTGWEKVIPWVDGESDIRAEKQSHYGKHWVWGREHEENGAGMQDLGTGV